MHQEDMTQFSNNLLKWFDNNARVLLWREDPAPYKVWISEVMLQQTRVGTVIPYFERFMAKAPTIEALAKLTDDELLKLWEGLGYYSRARNIKKAAGVILENFGGKVPSSLEDLLSLPGIGPYTSGAIASIAFQQKTPAIDGNVLRIMARVTANHRDIKHTKVKKEIETLVRQLLPDNRPGDFNQALMDLGATICLPNGAPKCLDCPLQCLCKAHDQGIANELPIKVKKKPRRVQKKTIVILQFKNNVALQQRPEDGLLSNLWEFPNLDGQLSIEEMKIFLEKQGITPKELLPLKSSKHIFSHIEWHMIGYYIEIEHISNDAVYTWVTKDDILHKYSIPSAFKAYTSYIIP